MNQNENENETTVATTYDVDGMTCGHCVSAVESELGEVTGVKNVQIELVKGGTSHVTVFSDERLDDAAVSAAIQEAGYVLTPTGSLL